ncbi:RNA-binding S4 domain-containing protein [Euzebya tangerina]|uniref:RNA-binding S4 domain-containing protein n=1 Tax=Euzebya tangerina TaxID=591198 RepID=UPI000E316C6B|nr:RNA-binding S4 domain-containing protein [Euzebya tangerina]
MSDDALDVPISGDTIKLGQFLKLANVIESGAHAKLVLADGVVTVNGEVEVRRGRQLSVGDAVEVAGEVFLVGEGHGTR